MNIIFFKKVLFSLSLLFCVQFSTIVMAQNQYQEKQSQENKLQEKIKEDKTQENKPQESKTQENKIEKNNTVQNQNTLETKNKVDSNSSAMSDSEEIISPENALIRLKEGNKRFAKNKSVCPSRNQERRTITARKQKPFAIVLGCSDSRVPPELTFDQGIGDIFVVRVAGNVVGDTELDSIEYSAIVNHSAIIVVLGHGSCGAVTAVLENNTKDIESIANFIRPAVEKHHNLEEATIANIQHSVDVIQKSPPIAKLISEGKIMVVGAYYELDSGSIRFLHEKKQNKHE